jgi:hypothetical protein
VPRIHVHLHADAMDGDAGVFHVPVPRRPARMIPWPMDLAPEICVGGRTTYGKRTLARVNAVAVATLVQISRWALSFTISPMLQLRAQKSRASWLVAGIFLVG